jgi:2,5-diamino-6-(ribosylamino)-4(3H)-pyrimidinone 5'-phosphate reductase
MRPYVICHMMTSIDGRTLTENWGKVAGRQAYEPTGNSFRANAWMSGRTTMERDFASKRPLKLKPAGRNLLKEDFVAGSGAKSFAIAVDKSGKLHWEKSEIDGDHLIVVLSERASQAYIADLRVKGISYIFGGEKDLDLKMVLEKLGSLFAIKKLMLEGGGHLNGSFLQAGLIDELSVVHVPIADCNANSPSLFEPGAVTTKLPVSKLRLLKVKKLENDVVWLRYKVR